MKHSLHTVTLPWQPHGSQPRSLLLILQCAVLCGQLRVCVPASFMHNGDQSLHPGSTHREQCTTVPPHGIHLVQPMTGCADSTQVVWWWLNHMFPKDFLVIDWPFHGRNTSALATCLTCMPFWHIWEPILVSSALGSAQKPQARMCPP